MAAEGLDPGDVPSRIRVRRDVGNDLRRRPAAGVVERVADGAGMRWRVAVAA